MIFDIMLVIAMIAVVLLHLVRGKNVRKGSVVNGVNGTIDNNPDLPATNYGATVGEINRLNM